MTTKEMINKSKELGSYWFSPSSMAFFDTVIETEPNRNDVFISSEQDSIAWNGERRYTVRQFDDVTGDVDDLSEFGEFSTLDEALSSEIYKSYS